MGCSQCQGIEVEFDKQVAESDLLAYRRKGASKTTRWLTRELRRRGVTGQTLLDIGGGVGAIQFELMEAGMSKAISVDASRSYMEVARREAERLGMVDRISYHHGDFVDLAAGIPEVDIVTLDRVICCYDDMHLLVSRSAAKARRWYGLVYPRDTWWMKLFESCFNLVYRLRGRAFRLFIHGADEVHELLTSQGLSIVFERRNLIWNVVLYGRES